MTVTVAQGVSTTVSRVKQSALGSAGSTGSQLMRRDTVTLNKTSPTYQSNEINSDQQSRGAIEGPYSTAGTLNAEMSPGTYALEYAALHRADFASAFTAITGASLTIAGSGPTYTVTRASGSFLSDGVKAGFVLRLSVGSLNAANIAKNLWVVSATATVLTVVPLNGVALVAEGPVTGCTLTSAGKITKVPTSGHTRDYFSWEKKFNDVTRYELFTDLMVASADVTIPATGIATNNFSLVGLGRALSGSETLTSPTAESTASLLTAVRGLIVINGAVTTITNLQFKIDGATTPGDPEIGSATLSDLQRGRVSVSGSFAAKFSGVSLQTLRDNQTVVRLLAAAAVDNTATADFQAFCFPAIKIFTDDADDGEKQIVRTYSFTAQYNSGGGSGTDSHQTISQLQDSLAA
jgi:hypothetical protein